MEVLDRHIEAIVFCASAPVKPQELLEALQQSLGESVSRQEVDEALLRIAERYRQPHFGIELLHVAAGYQFMTKPECRDSVSAFLKNQSKRRLSKSAIETLAIIAYKQPVSRSEIEQVRGVGCDYALKKLLEKELVEIKGKSEAIGRPTLYGTSEKFLQYFGIRSLRDMPTPAEFKEEDLGEIAPPADAAQEA